MDTRESLLRNWLTKECGFGTFLLQPIAGDASFRRYFRVQYQGQSWIAMDAPPDRENCVAYCAITVALRHLGLISPEVIKQNIADGLLLISDLGNRQLLKALNEQNAEMLYSEALNALAILQTCKNVSGWTIPPFTADFMLQELMLFKQWFLQSYLDLSFSTATEKMFEKYFRFLVGFVATQPMVFMHRDYHSANLMVLPQNKIGILDFQDAFMGPVTYDVVSLLRDCYIDWPEKMVTQLALDYKNKIRLSVSDELFLKWLDMMGLQRHLKALLTFSRKFKRDANPHYLKHIPRTFNYILKVCSHYPELIEFSNYLHSEVNEKVILCAE